MRRNIFVTVGTTQFPALIEQLSRPDVVKTLESCGYTHLTVQYGAGAKPQFDYTGKLSVETFAFASSIKEHVLDADLLISHAGAGTVLEGLGAGRRMITVINEALMDNHQTELAYQMFKDGHLLYCTTRELKETVKKIQTADLIPYVKGDPEKFAQFLDKVMGFQ